ncbi:MAG: hypothetical protein OXR68_01980 [Alphaproteobacteria bacterium]|nr:hypothetical protein [Alphaproteobacteria bacterium]MDD9919379.1 hypothetical protein [Alphaproteobacteria bacterium]
MPDTLNFSDISVISLEEAMELMVKTLGGSHKLTGGRFSYIGNVSIIFADQNMHIFCVVPAEVGDGEDACVLKYGSPDKEPKNCSLSGEKLSRTLGEPNGLRVTLRKHANNLLLGPEQTLSYVIIMVDGKIISINPKDLIASK